MGNQIVVLTEQTFTAAIDSREGPILVDFWAEWCMPCRALASVIDELSLEFSGKVRFAKVNVDESGGVASKQGIRGIPTLLVFQGGKKVGELVGNQAKEKIRALLTTVLGTKLH